MTSIPMDPLDEALLPPHDVDACRACDGTGGIPTGDHNPWRNQVEYDECPDCTGTGSMLAGRCCHPGAPCEDCAYDQLREQRLGAAS